MTEEVAGRAVKLRAEPCSWPSDHGQCDPNGGKMVFPGAGRDGLSHSAQ